MKHSGQSITESGKSLLSIASPAIILHTGYVATIF